MHYDMKLCLFDSSLELTVEALTVLNRCTGGDHTVFIHLRAASLKVRVPGLPK